MAGALKYPHNFENDSTSEDEDFIDLINQVNARVRRPKVFKERCNHFIKWGDKEFKDRFRLPKPIVSFLIEELGDEIASKTDKNCAVSPDGMIFITLRYLATGAFGGVIGDLDGVDKSTVSRIIQKVTKVLAGKRPNFMPTTAEEKNSVMLGFYNISKFPRCLGAIDCTHIKIQSPGGDNAEIFRNRKGFFSINVQAICDAELKINDVVCRWPGSAHDSNIFKNSRIRYRLEHGEFEGCLLLGDSGYGLKNYLLTPLANPQTEAERLYNESQIRTRNPIERMFGVLKKRFPILAVSVRLKLDRVEAIVISAMILHNIARSLNDHTLPDIDEDLEAAIQVTENVVAENNNNIANNVNNMVRRQLIEYFSTL